MHPPLSVCRSLYALHPQLRLAWAGCEPKSESELNPGSFALVQLYHLSDVGGTADPHTYRTLWDVEPVADMWGIAEMRRIDRGPIFNRRGGTRPDWDPLFRVPVFVATLDKEYGVSREDILSGRIVEILRNWMRPIQERIETCAAEKGRQLDRDVDAMGREIAKDVWREAQKPDAETVIMANKHCRKDIEHLESRKQFGDGLKDYYSPPGL